MSAASRLELWPEHDLDDPFADVWIGRHKSGPAAPSAADWKRWRERPIRWAVERMGIPEHTLRWSLNPGYKRHEWDGDPDPLVLAWQSLADGENVGVESATGVGKTFAGALIVLWFLDCFAGSTVVTAAPKQDQLALHIWKEIAELWPRFQRIRPDAELTALRIRMVKGSDKWAAHGFVAGVGAEETGRSATRAQGFHAEHMLIVTEETPGIHPAVMTAFENTSTAPHNLRLAFGNPDHQLDELHRFCQSPGVRAIRASALDHPNVVTGNASIIPGAVARPAIERRRQMYGADHPLYQSRVRGVSPAQATDALIRLEWLQAAARKTRAEKEAARRQGPRALGHDVANSEHGDRASLAFGEGALLERVESYRCPDANRFYREHVHPLIGKKLAPSRVGIDTVGVGAGAYNEAVRLGDEVVSLNGADDPLGDPNDEEVYRNLRSQMYRTFAKELFDGEIAIEEEDEELFADLTAPKWGTKNGESFVESKEELKKRLPGRRSPDKGDAAVYWNWVRKDRPEPEDDTFATIRHRA